jgi:glycosyltransferase involved in cell wall biosynthesis
MSTGPREDGLPPDAEDLRDERRMEEEREAFEDHQRVARRWHEENPPRPPIRPVKRSCRTDGLPTIGLALIARDEEERLPALLDSVGFTPGRAGMSPGGRPEAAVDYVVVCDTGSVDRTKEVALSRGCQVTNFEWRDDFSAARQASYDALPPWVDWTLWADCDDVIEGAENLRSLAANSPPHVGGWIFPYDYATDEAGNVICYLERERLVRKGIGERWELPIHEVLRVEANLVRSDAVRWVHRRDGKQIDPKRNYRVLKRDWERSRDALETPNPRTLVYLGTESLALGKHSEAIRWLKDYLRVGTWDEELCQAAHKLSVAYRLAGQMERAEQAAYRAIGHRPDWPEGYLDLAEIALTREQPERALHFIGVAKERGQPQTLLIINPLDYTYQPLLMESVCLAKLGQIPEALAATQQVLQITPYREDLQRQHALLTEALKRAETIKHVLALRELLVRHDENLKADALMRLAVPYYVHDDIEIARARADCRENVLHATEPEVYAAYYRENPGEAEFESHGIAIKKAHEHFPRLAYLRENLEQQEIAA